MARGLRRRWTVVFVAIKMAEQERLVTGFLPDDSDAEATGNLLGLLPPVGIAIHLIGIHQDRPTRELSAPLTPAVYFLRGPAQSRYRVASTRVEGHDVEVNGNVGTAQEVV